MKKFTALILALIMILSLTTVAFAGEAYDRLLAYRDLLSDVIMRRLAYVKWAADTIVNYLTGKYSLIIRYIYAPPLRTA